MWQRRTFLALCGSLALMGCGPGGLKEEVIEVKAANDPLHMPRSILQRYADGQKLGSEVTGFPAMIEAVRKVDKDRAEILEAGLKEIETGPPGQLRAKAKELLAKLQPSMT